MGPILYRSPLKQISLIVNMKTRQETQSTKKIHCAIAGLEDGVVSCQEMELKMGLQLAASKEMGTSVLQLQGTNFVKNRMRMEVYYFTLHSKKE